MRARSLVDRAMDAIQDLIHARPHMRTSARYDVRELQAYHEGYYAALIAVLRAVDHARIVHQHVAEAKRRATRKAKSA